MGDTAETDAGARGAEVPDTDGTVRSKLWRNGKLEKENFDFERISDHLEEPDALIWVDLCDPDHRLLMQLADELSLDPLAVEDAISHGERAKLTRYPSHIFLTAYATEIQQVGPSDARDIAHQRLMLHRISAFLLDRGIVTVRSSDGFDVAELQRRWEANADLLRLGPGALLHGLLDQIVDSHFDAIQTMDDALEEIEDTLFEEDGRGTEVQRRSYRIRRDLVALRRVVLPMREVVGAAMRIRSERETPRELDSWYLDLYDHVQRATEWTESLRDMVSTIFETNLSLQDARLNNVMKKLTGWAAVIAVPTAVTGFYGQNVPYPGYGTHLGYLISMVLMIGIAAGLYAALRVKKWI
jgi:magnesium transporter